MGRELLRQPRRSVLQRLLFISETLLQIGQLLVQGSRILGPA